MQRADPAVALLTTAEMAAADAQAVAQGTPSLELMARAGEGVAQVAGTMLPIGGRILVLAGPGNNGGDAFVAAYNLRAQGYAVRVALLGDVSALKGDAAVVAAQWAGPILPLDTVAVSDCDLIIDGLFGAGLSRPISGPAAAAVGAVNATGLPVLAIDVPSGLDGSTGAAAGPVIQATQTVTFFTRKPGHLLLPGRRLCGPVHVVDIGIPAQVLEHIGPRTFVNGPVLWGGSFPHVRPDGHKYSRGHAVVVSGPPESTGAARLSARGALRAGAGLLTVASPQAAFPINAAHLTAIMLAPFDAPEGLSSVLSDGRRNALLIGPGCGVGPVTCRMVEIALASQAAVVLDADALTSFAASPPHSSHGGQVSGPLGFIPEVPAPPVGNPARLYHLIKSRGPRPVVLTPHEGEFKRLFGSAVGSRLERARRAAAESGAIVVLKGADTCVADPDGRASINENAPPWLATAGSGDVLAGFITGLLAQGMPPFEAASAAVWLHGAVAHRVGPGLIAEDLADQLPPVLTELVRALPA